MASPMRTERSKDRSSPRPGEPYRHIPCTAKSSMQIIGKTTRRFVGGAALGVCACCGIPERAHAAETPKLSYWHIWTDTAGVTHQTRCQLHDFELRSILRPPPSGRTA